MMKHVTASTNDFICIKENTEEPEKKQISEPTPI
jgi:hypothetical protein